MKPDFLVIGAMKAGTSSLYRVLRGHPQIAMCREKDVGFFSFDRVYSRGWGWYVSLFDVPPEARAVGEASVSYTKRAIEPHTVSRIGKHIPDAKFVYMVRHPMARIESHYLEMCKRRSHQLRGTFSRAVRELRTLVETSLYWKQLCWYRDHFPEERIRVVFFEDYVRDPQRVASTVFDFLGVDADHRIGDAQAPNPSFGAWRDRSINTQLRKLPLYDRVQRRWIPSGLRNVIRPFLKKPIIERPGWDDVTRQWAREELAEDSRQLLAYCGKSPDFWLLD